MDRSSFRPSFRATLLPALLALAASCAAPPKPAETFDSAEKAVDALIAALRANDVATAKTILGDGADDVLSSGDEVSDKNALAAFLAAYDEKHQLVAAPDGGMNLQVGSSDWPLPIPVVHNGEHWAFDTAAGLDELLSRRIGRNELDAVQVCLAIVDAQRDFAASDPDGDGVQEYARKFLSSEGKRDGLYWPTKEGEPDSPLGPLIADAEEHGYKSGRSGSGAPHPYHGYNYRMLMAQGPSADGGERDYVVNGKMIGGFAVLAWPAEYANSGIMTFMVNHDGVVFQKDLGEDTEQKGRQITTYSPGAGWSRVQ